MSAFIHFSKAPLTAVRTVDPVCSYRLDKPSGLWFSVGDGDDGWRAWCEAEGYDPGCLVHRTELVFAPDARLLRVCGADDLDAFTQRFGIECPYPEIRSYGRGYGIDWRAVAEHHDAIAVAPYLYERRLHPKTFWYNSWDCASGCVWNATAVKEIRVLVATETEHA